MAVDDSQETQSTSQTHDSHTSKSKESDSRPGLDDGEKLPLRQVQQPLLYHDDDDDDDNNDDGLPSIGDDSDHKIELGSLLLSHAIEGMNGVCCWNRRLLRHIITEARLSNELERLQIKCSLPSRQLRKSYISVVAILTLMNQLQRINAFVRCGVRDDVLPLDCIKRNGIYHMAVPADSSISLECFSELKMHAQEYFMDLQQRVTMPFFDLEEDGACKEYVLQSDSTLPWSSHNRVARFGFERYMVTQGIMMHPACHGFRDTLQKVTCPLVHLNI